MDAIRQYARAFIRSDDGATAIEYGLIAALIVVAMIGALTSLGGGVGGMWGDIGSKVSAVLS